MKYVKFEKNKFIDFLKQNAYKTFEVYVELFNNNKEMMLEILKLQLYNDNEYKIKKCH